MAVETGIRRIARPALARRIADALGTGSVLLVADAGYGKTMALDEAVELSGRRSVWLPCGDAGGGAARLLMGLVAGLRTAVPGLADVLAERLATGLEPVDVASAGAGLVAELEELLVERIVIVFDDAEELEDDPDALGLLAALLGVRGAPVSLAVATRRPLPLRLAKLRAAGRVTEFGPADLGFTAGECADLLRLRHGPGVTDDDVEAVIAASEGWPMGVALSGLARSPDAVPRDRLFEYLAEEVLDRLAPDLRLALVDSSVPDTLTPELADALGLPAGFLDQVDRSGVFVRAHGSGARSYHPLLRAFLRDRLLELRSAPERAAFHARCAEVLSGTDRQAEAIEHWLAAGEHERALADLATHGAELVRTSPATVAWWLERLPETLHGAPDHLLLRAQLLWGAGQHQRAVAPLRAAAAGHEAAGHADRAWVARLFLADSLLFLGAFEELAAVATGWEDAPGPIAAMIATAVAWYHVVALACLGRVDEGEALAARLGADPQAAAQFRFLDVLARSGTELAAGAVQEALGHLHAAIAELEVHDPFGRLSYPLGMVLVMLRTFGERQAALEWLDRCERAAEQVGLGFGLRDFRLQRASLLAREGDLSGAEVALAAAGAGTGGAGWRGWWEAEAQAHVAALRGDVPAAVAAARRTLACASGAPMPWRALATVEMADLLVRAAAPDAAAGAIDAALRDLDVRFPGARGRLHRAWLLGARARLEHATGAADESAQSLARAWEAAGGEAAALVRALWPGIRPVLWHALAEGVIAPGDVVPAMQDALAGGEALVAMVDHPEPAVRAAALTAALAAGHPELLARLDELAKDRDERVSAAAAATRERLRDDPPPLRFELLGGFRVRRGGWELDDAAWGRPMAARVVRFLLVQGDGAVPEDALFEAFWSDRTADAARQHLAVAVSRARKVLDLPGARTSVIENRERTYRLRLRERDAVDSVEFERAAAAALAVRGEERGDALERAAALWAGELPLPEDRYAAWSFAWRGRLVDTYAQVLGALLDGYEATGRHHDVVRACRRLLAVDPLDERAHRRLMAAYARGGRTSYALRQYLECRRALVVELGVEPSAETSALQARILAGEPV